MSSKIDHCYKSGSSVSPELAAANFQNYTNFRSMEEYRGSGFTGKITHARVAPAASMRDSDGLAGLLSPRSGNTGGSSMDDISDRINIHRHCDKVLEKVGEIRGYTKLDWLTVSFTGASSEDDQGVLFNYLSDFLADYSIEIQSRGRGLHGYTNSASLIVRGDVSGDVNCGMLAWSDVQGVFLELSGQGCEFTRSGFADLYRIIVTNAGRISRADICLDLENKYCIENKITVPLLGKQAYNGAFRARNMPAMCKQSMKNEGDWSDITYGSVTPESYDPAVNAPNGLTAYVGSVKSDNQIVFYEKGKQLLGAIDDVDYLEYQKLLATGKNRERLVQLMNDNNLDITYEGQKHWVRTERRFRRGSNKKWLPPEMLLAPDQMFIQDFEGLRVMLDHYTQWLGRNEIRVIDFSKRASDLTKSILLTRKMHWAKVAYGRLMRTLTNLGLSAAEIMDSLTRAEGLKDFITDIKEEASQPTDILEDSTPFRVSGCSYDFAYFTA